MKIEFQIISTAKKLTDTVDYNLVIFKVRAANLLDIDGGRELFIFSKTLIDGGALKILMDMEGLDFLDSSGIGLLINIAKMVRARGGDLALLAVPPNIEMIMRPVHLERFIKSFPMETEALAFFKYV